MVIAPESFEERLGKLPEPGRRYRITCPEDRLALAEELLRRCHAIMSKANHDNSYEASIGCINDARTYLQFREGDAT